jgi:hypothetical protein
MPKTRKGKQMFAEIKADEETIEKLIDKLGISIFLQNVSYICGQKSDRIAENWQDANLAKQWLKVSSKLDDAASIAMGL